jgi:hypothetical protein
VVSVADPLRPYSRFSRLEPLLFLPSSSSIVLTRLSGPRSRHIISQKSGYGWKDPLTTGGLSDSTSIVRSRTLAMEFSFITSGHLKHSL